MSKTMIIGGWHFQRIDHRKPYSYDAGYGTTLDDVYGDYSQAKYNAWSRCKYWANNAGIEDFGVTSYNTFSFSLGGFYTDPETGEVGVIEITPCHNRIHF